MVRTSKFVIGMCIGFNLFTAAYAYAAPATAAKSVAPGTMRPVAVCADGGTFSNDSGDHRGACSGHGGVVKWMDGSVVKSGKKHTTYTPAK